ncbi:MAG: V-type ATP synthase subunit A, partial [Spirochaetota bacterium]
VWYLKGEFTDSVYLQQNAFDPVDAAVGVDRQRYTFGVLFDLLTSKLNFGEKEEARSWFAQLRQRFLDFNGTEWQSDSFKELEADIKKTIDDRRAGVEDNAASLVGEMR